MKYLAILMLLISSAQAADKAVILSDQEQVALRNILDIATKAQGLAIAGDALYFANKINQAGVVTDQKAVPDKKEGGQ
jgi:hypothetical protein